MRKIFKFQLLVLSVFASSTLFAQKIVESAIVRDGQCYIKRCTAVPDNCNAATHPIFDNPTTKKPIKLSHLGSSKQFAVPNNNVGNSATEVYQNLKRAYREDKADAKELDKLWRAMGYNGFRDPSFTMDKVGGAEEFPAGTLGMIGNGKNTYQYAEFGNAFNGFRIHSNNSCDIFIMQNCGNAFHSHTSSLFGYNNCTETLCSAPPVKCDATTLSGSKKDSASVSGQFGGTQEIRILARNQGDKNKGAVLCLGKAAVPYNASYEVMVNGTAVASQSVSTCPDNRNQVIPITLTLKKGMVKDNKVSFGQDGRAYIDVNQKQFNALSKVFDKCCPTDCAPVK